MRAKTTIAAGVAAAALATAPVAHAAEQQAYAVGLNYATPVVTATKDKLVCEFKGVSDAKARNGTVSTLAKFQVNSGTPKLHQL